MRKYKSIITITIGVFTILLISIFISETIKLLSFQSILIFALLIIIFFRSNKFILLLRKTLIKSIKYKKTSMTRNSRIAAQRSIQSLKSLIDKIHNDVSVKALLESKERIEKDLLRGDLCVVIFGTGSTGKTSIVRCLINEIVGEVGPILGSTKSSSTYRMRLIGIERGIQIIDTPGIFESGYEGNKRKKESLIKASQADLIIIVVDNDLRSIEIELISNLSKAGKKILIVLNKCDLRGEKEVYRLLAVIKDRTKSYVNPEDVIEATASPQTIPRKGENPLQPRPEIDKLIRRISKVLHDEGEELLANNILIQCRNLGISGRRLLNKQRKYSAIKCVDRFSWISSGVVIITPLPGIDLLGTAAVNGQMVMEISRIYGVKLTKERAKELALSVAKTLAGLGIVKSGISIVGNALSLSVPTLLVGRIIQGVSAAWLTKVAGESFITYFSQDQDWGDGGIQEVVQHHFNLNKRESSLKKFVETALEKVIDPIKRKEDKQLPPRRRPQVEEEE